MHTLKLLGRGIKCHPIDDILECPLTGTLVFCDPVAQLASHSLGTHCDSPYRHLDKFKCPFAVLTAL